jgi:hypothetical protein
MDFRIPACRFRRRWELNVANSNCTTGSKTPWVVTEGKQKGNPDRAERLQRKVTELFASELPSANKRALGSYRAGKME